MKILLLGNSDTQGIFVDGPTWAGVLREVLANDLGTEVTVTEVKFSAVSPAGPAYAERKVRELQPDLVVLPLGTFAFTVGFSWKRIERLFGERMGARYRRAEEAFDKRTRQAGDEPPRFNRAARKFVRRLIGTQPLTSQERLTANYGDVIRTISRIEDVDLLLVAYPAERGKHVTVRHIEQRRAAFLGDVGREAQLRHFGLLDSGPLFAAAPADPPLMTTDGFHLQRAGHELLGRAVAEAVLQRRGTAAGSRT